MKMKTLCLVYVHKEMNECSDNEMEEFDNDWDYLASFPEGFGKSQLGYLLNKRKGNDLSEFFFSEEVYTLRICLIQLMVAKDSRQKTISDAVSKIVETFFLC